MCPIQQQSVPYRKCGGLATGSGEYHEREFARNFTQSFNAVSRGNCHLELCMQRGDWFVVTFVFIAGNQSISQEPTTSKQNKTENGLSLQKFLYALWHYFLLCGRLLEQSVSVLWLYVTLSLCCLTDSSDRVGVTVAWASSYRWSPDSLDQRSIRSIDWEQDRRTL